MRLSSLRRWFRASSRRFVRPSRPRRPEFEVLEDRAVPAVITVTGTGDTLAVDGLVTLREAITSANNDANVNADVSAVGAYGADVIQFNIAGGGVHTIHLTGALPVIQGQLDIQGYSQFGSSPNTLTVGDDAKPLIELDGSGAGANAYGLRFFFGNNSSVSGLVINRFDGSGIFIDDGTDIHIWGNFIGTDATGTLDLGNARDGVFTSDDNTLIGGPTAAERNVISGNDGDGVFISGNPPVKGVVIQGNYIGTDRTGLVAVGNDRHGVANHFSTGTVIGGSGAGRGNLISGNASNGIDFQSATGAVVAGNRVGTDATGTKALGNGGAGIGVGSDSSNNTIGGPAAGAGNLVSGNQQVGIFVGGNDNLIQGNRVGTTADGLAALGNLKGGMNVFGLNTTVRDNLVSGNSSWGVIILSAPSTQLKGNRIGTNAAGTAALGNTGDGVSVLTSPGLFVGGSSVGDGNIISGNGGAGVLIDSFGVQVRGNFIGTDVSGTAAVGNDVGVRIAGNNNTIGGVTLATGNIISGNTSDGLLLDATANGNQIQGNRIGTDVNGVNALGNGLLGVEIVGGEREPRRRHLGGGGEHHRVQRPRRRLRQRVGRLGRQQPDQRQRDLRQRWHRDRRPGVGVRPDPQRPAGRRQRREQPSELPGRGDGRPGQRRGDDHRHPGQRPERHLRPRILRQHGRRRGR